MTDDEAGPHRPRRIHTFDTPDRFVAGTVGEPGARSFYLQARSGSRIVSVGLEKGQVEILAERLGELLDELGRRGVAVEAPAPPGEPDAAPLESPVDEEFRVAAIALGWDPEREMVVLEAQAQGGSDTTDALTDAPDGPDVLRVHVTPAAARAFVERARRVVAAGRPPCPLCGLPLDAPHVCPRQNGHRPTS
jgi:uncharacterized repeat protein (TIGR03847 family)